MQDKDVRLAAQENCLRRKLAAELQKSCTEESVSLRALASKMGTSLSQVQRILNKSNGGGNLTIRTLLNAADALGLELDILLTPKGAKVK